MNRPQKYTAVAISKELVCARIYIARFRLKDPPNITFESGQHLLIHVADGVNRSMSIASKPGNTSEILICHDVTPMGPGSLHMVDLHVGDEISFTGPLGIFRLDKSSARRKIFVATGTGIAPFRSMILDYLESGGTAALMLYWGLRHDEDVYWQQEFEKIAARYANFHFLTTLSQPSDAWTGARGRVTDHMFSEEKELANADIYLCGNKMMVSDVKTRLSALGVPNEQIRTDIFY